MPSRATTSSRPSAGIGSLGHELLDEQEIVRRVDVERQRTIDLDVAGADLGGAGGVGGRAVAAEAELDRIRWRDNEAVRAAAVAIRGEDDERPLRDGSEGGDELLEGRRR